MSADHDALLQILQQYGITQPLITPIATGLINHTWLIVEADRKYTLQCVNPMFTAEIHQDIATVTAHLAGKGALTLKLVNTADKRLYIQQGGQLWRLYNYLEGTTFNQVAYPAIAFQAGTVLARFHAGLLDLDYQFKNTRSGVHDTNKHLQTLRTALQTRQDHVRFKAILPLATEILAIAETLPELPVLPARKVHGDPKINNFLFETLTGKGLCLLDLDTLGNMALPLELGDAMRSWCNPAGENSQDAFFSLDNFRAGLQGYIAHAGEFILAKEWQAILTATQTIYVELAARFCADALIESFFSWDPSRFDSRSEHNQIRAKSQLQAFKSLRLQLREAEQIVEDIFNIGS
jgi:Ser/Thr protein kinase RdoA (MazF antagonist)